MEAHEAAQRLEGVKPSLHGPTAEEQVVLFEARADRARELGFDDLSRENALKSARAAAEIAITHVSNPVEVPIRIKTS